MKFSRMLTVVDSHTGGNPERIVTAGVPTIPGDSMLEKLRFVRDHMDYLRTFLVHEPRGHDGMHASLITPSTTRDADFGVLYLEPGGYDMMCGHGTMAICTVLVETGIVPAKEPLTEIALDTPAGVVHAKVAVRDGKAESVTIRNVPSFLYKRDAEVEVPDLGRVKVDIAYGGNFYAILPARAVGLVIAPEHAAEIIDYGIKIWKAVNDQLEIHHPEYPEFNCVSYVQFSAPPTQPAASMKNVVVGPPAGIDRSPCGTGTSAKMATLWARGELKLNQEFVHESVVGSLFYGQLVEETSVGQFKAAVSTIRGSAWITGVQQFVLDPTDPFPAGFVLGKQEKLFGAGSDS